VYLRQHKSGRPDAMQHTPILNTGLNWQIYSGPGFTGAVDIPKDGDSFVAWRTRKTNWAIVRPRPADKA
jgi:hypothetical protein